MWFLYLLSISLSLAREFTVSGISSGAFMATQMHFAYSNDVKSSAVIAGGPYYCATGLITSTATCMLYPQFIPIGPIFDYIYAQEKLGNIDSTSNMKDSTVFLYSGLFDTVIIQPIVAMNEVVYKQYIDHANISTEYNVASEHAWITDYYGSPCILLISPYINNCNLDIAEKILTVAYGELQPKKKMVNANLRSFNQKQYISKSSSSLADTGYIYIPSSCTTSTCRIHVAFHGCGMSYSTIGDSFIRISGLNEWAEGNDIVILYPQTVSSILLPMNPQGCWDWWGYSGQDYAIKTGVQMKAVYDMVQNPPKVDNVQYI